MRMRGPKQSLSTYTGDTKAMYEIDLEVLIYDRCLQRCKPGSRYQRADKYFEPQPGKQDVSRPRR